jgi:hypothetical protein
MDNLYAVTFRTLDDNLQSVEVQAPTAREARQVFEANYTFDETADVDVVLVSNRRDY